MKGIATAIRGYEDICRKDIMSIGIKKAEAKEGIIEFEAKDYIDLAKVAYNIRTSSRVFLLLKEFKIGNEIEETAEEAKKALEDIDFKEFLSKETTFKVECERNGEHLFNSSEVEMEFGAVIIKEIEEKHGYRQKVSLDNPDCIVYVQIEQEKCYFGIDFCGFDISKRDYHIFTNKTSIKGTLAASLVLDSGIKNKETVMDVMCGSGTVPIEAALISENTPPFRFKKDDFAFKKLPPLKNTDFDDFFNKEDNKKQKMQLKVFGLDPPLPNMTAASKNAKIAGVQKLAEFSKMDFEWLDTKIEEKSVDRIITKLPAVSNNRTEKEISKIYDEFFYQAEYILKKSGHATILLPDERMILESAKKYKFRKNSIRDIMIGKMAAKVIKLEK